MAISFLSITNLEPLYFISMPAPLPSRRHIRAGCSWRSNTRRRFKIRVTVQETVSVELVGAQGAPQARHFGRSCVVTVGSKCVLGDSNIFPYPSSGTDQYRCLVISLGSLSKRRILKRTLVAWLPNDSTSTFTAENAVCRREHQSSTAFCPTPADRSRTCFWPSYWQNPVQSRKSDCSGFYARQ